MNTALSIFSEEPATAVHLSCSFRSAVFPVSREGSGPPATALETLEHDNEDPWCAAVVLLSSRFRKYVRVYTVAV
jgi:hypothetical protein